MLLLYTATHGLSTIFVRKMKLNTKVSAALYNISTTRTCALRPSILENAWASRFDAPREGWNLEYDRRRKDQEEETRKR